MSYLDVTHIAVEVPDLREAEAFYRQLFELEVAWRDSEGGASLFATWAEIDAAGATPVVVMLWRDAFRLALGLEATENRQGVISHVGLQVTRERVQSVRDQVTRLGLRMLHARDDELLTFEDRYGAVWELDTRSYRDPREIGLHVEERQRHQR